MAGGWPALDGRRRLVIIGFVVFSIIPTLATFNPIMRVWLWPHLAWAYALEPAAILAVGAVIDLARIRLLERPVMGWVEQRWGERLSISNGWLLHIEKPLVRNAAEEAKTE